MRKLIAGFIFLSINNLNAQAPNPQLPAILPPTPEASALTKNAELSIGLFSGAAQTSVPLYEIKLKEFSLPVSLNYAANGFKVDEIPSRVGLGWSLSAGGVITRIVNGKPDELSTRYNPPATLNQSLQSLTYYYELSAENGTYDAEPDEFRIAAPGLSGKFVIDTSGIPVIIPYANYKIQVNGTNPYTEFIITNTEGVKYFFGGASIETTTNHTIEGKLNGITQINTGFFLKKIETPNMDSINFYYSSLSTRQITGITHSVSTAAGLYMGGCLNQSCTVGGTNFSESASDVTYNGLLLDSIKASNGAFLKFKYENRPDNGGDKRLIYVYVYEGSNTKKYTMLYETPQTSSYTAHSMSNYNKRFFLKELQTTAARGDTMWGQILKHNFEYIDLAGLPPRLSYAQDHYGFFNGKNNSNLLPANYAQTAYGNFGGYANADRSSAGAFEKKGLLRRITYPTGGYDSITYEPNSESTSQQVNTTPVIHEFLSGQGTGVAEVATYTTSCLTPKRNLVSHINLVAEISPSCTECQPPEEGVDKIVELYLRNVTTGNNVVLYRQLRYFTNLSDTITLLANNCYTMQLKVYGDYSYGQSELEYDTAAQETYTTVITWHDAPGVRVKQTSSYDPLTGVINNRYYKYCFAADLNGSSSTALIGLSYLSNSYSKTICNDGIFNSYMICFWNVLSSNSNSYQYFSDNNMYGYRAVLESNDPGFANGLTEHIFEGSPYSTGLAILGNDLRGVPTNTLSWFNGYETATRYYNKDLQIIKSVNNYLHVDTDVNKIVVGVIAKRKYEPILPPDTPVYPDEIDPYDVTQYFYQSNWIKHDSTVTKVYDSKNQIMSSTMTNYYGSSVNILPIRTETYNSKKQLIKEEKKYPTDYAGQAPYQRMIDKNIISPLIENKSYVNDTVKYILRNNYFDFSMNTSQGTPVLIKPQTTQVQQFSGPLETRIRFLKYDAKGNPVELSKEDDLKLVYIWDYNKNYPVAEIKNTDSSSVAYTSFEGDGKGNWTFAGAPVSDITAPTGVKAYNLASGNLTRAVTSSAYYIISYWRPVGSSSLTIAGTQSGYPITGRTVNGWTYYEHKVSGMSTVTLSGSGLIDEVRLYPFNAQMMTYTYEPLIGITTQCDMNNLITHYEYDAFGRLKLIRDQDNNIIKTFDYQYQQPVN